MRPVIGITTYAQEASWGVWRLPAALIPLDYVDAVERAGGRPVLIPPSENGVAETLDTLDGIVFSGGADVDPSLYGAEPHPETDTPQARRDAGELALLEAALERDMPTLADLPRLPAPERRARRRPRPASPRRGRERRAQAGAGRLRRALRRGEGRHAPRVDGRRPLPCYVAPSPGNRAPGGRARRGGLGGRRHARGRRGPDPALPGRRAVASRGGTRMRRSSRAWSRRRERTALPREG